VLFVGAYVYTTDESCSLLVNRVGQSLFFSMKSRNPRDSAEENLAYAYRVSQYYSMGPSLPGVRVRWRCVCVVITLKCAFFIIIIAGRYHTQLCCCSPLRTPQPRQHSVVYSVPVYLCARSSSSSYSLTYCLSVCNSGPAPDGLTRFSYLLCTGRVARAVYRHRRSSLLSNGFAAAVVYTRHLLTHTSYRTT